MSCGTPTIVSKGCGASEVLEDMETSLLINPFSPNEIAQKIILLKNNPNLVKKISRRGRIFVENNILWEKYTNNMLKIFQGVSKN